MKVQYIAGLALAAAGCVKHVPQDLSQLQSFGVAITDPPASMLGTPAMPVTFSDVTMDIHALASDGGPFTEDVDVDVYISYAGDKIGSFDPCGKNDDVTPIETVTLPGGVLYGHKTHLPRAYGVTNVWIEQTPAERALVAGDGGVVAGNAVATHALGASPTIYFPNPTIPDVQTPPDLTAPTALYCSPFNQKHVIVDHATGMGKLVVTSVFINAYVVTDTGAQFDPKSGKGGFNNMYVFSFGRPDAAVVPGRVMANISGNVGKFVGFTELNFPLQEYTDTVDPMLIPPPYVLTAADPGNNLKLLRISGGVVTTTAKPCTIDVTNDNWRKYNQFGLDYGDGACNASSFQVALPGKTLGGFDPLKLPGTVDGQITKRPMITVTGMLRNFSGQTLDPAMTPCKYDTQCSSAYPSCVEGTCSSKTPYAFWTINPRDESDVVYPH